VKCSKRNLRFISPLSEDFLTICFSGDGNGEKAGAGRKKRIPEKAVPERDGGADSDKWHTKFRIESCGFG
jgi:hypothetical protein